MRLFLCVSAAAALAVVSTLALPASAGEVSQTEPGRASDRTQTAGETTPVPQPIPTQPVGLSAQPAVATQPGVPQPVADQRPAWCYTLSGADEHRRFGRVCHPSPRHGRPHRR